MSMTNGIPRATAKEDDSWMKELYDVATSRDLPALQKVLAAGVTGAPWDDKEYLMESIIDFVAKLNVHSPASDKLTNDFLDQLWNDLAHPPTSYLGYDYVFRKADGANNNIQWPHIGKAGQPYARSVAPERSRPPPPDPSVVFDSVLKRKKFKPHPNKISSVLFYMASIIIHDCFHTSHVNYAISETSSYLDLAPLYGSNQVQQNSVRAFKDGKLKPDCFADNRIHGFPAGVAVLLVMFNRFHNNVVENLAKIDEGGRFSQLLNPQLSVRSGLVPPKDANQPPLSPEQEKEQCAKYYDEALFQTGRLVTCGLYVNIILQDYVRTILGMNRCESLWNLNPRAGPGNAPLPKKTPTAVGNQCSAEFSLVYRWHSTVSERDTLWSKQLVETITKAFPGKSLMIAAGLWSDKIKETPPEKRTIENLKRGADGRYSNEDLCEIWTAAVDDVAGAFGAQHVPEALQFVEVLSMIQARSWNLASLNEFRKFFHLKPHAKFTDINEDPEVARALEKLYGHVDNVEIYPGIVVESAKKSMSPGSGLCASWTTSRAILADAVALVRGDRFYTVDYTPTNLTNWGFQAASYDTGINYGGLMYKLILNAFPGLLPQNSIYAHFPMVNPPENKVLLTTFKKAHLYNFDNFATLKSRRAPVQAKASSDVGAQALDADSSFVSPLQQRSAALGAPEDARAVATIKLTFARAILDNPDLQKITTKFYTDLLTDLLKKQQYELGGFHTVDIVADVLNRAHVFYITRILGIPALDNKGGAADEPHELLDALAKIQEQAYGASADAKAMAQKNRGFFSRIADGIGSLFTGDGAPKVAGELGAKAFTKMKAVNGANGDQLAWQDILPTISLILVHLSVSSTTTVENLIPEANPISKTAPVDPALTIAVRATETVGDIQEGQVVVVKVAAKSDQKVSPDIELAQKVAAICNTVVTDLIGKIKNVTRQPGPQGVIKKIPVGGEIKYLNENESEYLAYPASMKIRWA